MRTTRVSFILFAMAIMATACNRGPDLSPTPAASDDSGTIRQAIPVQVSNQNYNTMNIYLVRQGARWLVGQINGLSDSTITIPASLAPPDHQVRLRAEAIGGGAVTTPTLIVAPGQRVYWTVGSDLSTSTASAG
jgi:hypothetical protein